MKNKRMNQNEQTLSSRLYPFVVLGLLPLCGLLIACGSGGGSGDGDGGGDRNLESGKVGLVRIWHSASMRALGSFGSSGTSTVGTIDAAFGDVSLAAWEAGSGCREIFSGDVSAAEPGDLPDLDPAELVSPGTVSVTGTGEPISLTPDEDDNGSYDAKLRQPLWALDASTNISAVIGGDDTPAASLSVPSPMVTTYPFEERFFEMPQGKDFPVTWESSSTSGTARFSFIGTKANSQISLFHCDFPLSAGSGTIDGTLTADLKGLVTLTFYAFTRADQAVGDWTMTLVAEDTATFSGTLVE